MKSPTAEKASLEGIMEAAVYCQDLDAASRFYTSVLGLDCVAREEGHYVFLRSGETILLIFDPQISRKRCAVVGGGHIPSHGSVGAGHVAFRTKLQQIPAWRRHLRDHDVPIESEVAWPHGGCSIYFRDPGNNSIEIATPRVWGKELQPRAHTSSRP